MVRLLRERFALFVLVEHCAPNETSWKWVSGVS
jgi:hypothetical protein